MPTVFEELAALDRPFVEIETTIRNKPFKAKVRALSGEEEDELDVIQMNEYGRLIKEMTESKTDGLSELERVRAVYATKSASEIVEQLIVTREPDIQRRAVELSGINFQAEIKKMSELPEDERDAYAAKKNEEFEAARKMAEDEIRADLTSLPVDHLADQVAQVNINVRALSKSRATYNSVYLAFALHDEAEKQVFKDHKHVTETLSGATVEHLVKVAQEALRTDLPFESPGDSAPNGPQPSASTSEPETTP